MIYGMNARTKKLRDEVLELPREEALALARDVLNSLDDETGGTPEELEKAWAEELARRAMNVFEGRSRGRPAEEVIAELRAELLAKR
jgi:putative addiction module component (TIGR02574 family)